MISRQYSTFSTWRDALCAFFSSWQFWQQRDHPRDAPARHVLQRTPGPSEALHFPDCLLPQCSSSLTPDVLYTICTVERVCYCFFVVFFFIRRGCCRFPARPALGVEQRQGIGSSEWVLADGLLGPLADVTQTNVHAAEPGEDAMPRATGWSAEVL